MRNTSIEVRPIAGALGAELHGIDLSRDLPDDTVALLRQALLDHLVIFFRDQDLPPDRFLALARRFGTPVEYPSSKGSRATRRSSPSPSYRTKPSTSAVSGIPTPPI